MRMSLGTGMPHGAVLLSTNLNFQVQLAQTLALVQGGVLGAYSEVIIGDQSKERHRVKGDSKGLTQRTLWRASRSILYSYCLSWVDFEDQQLCRSD